MSINKPCAACTKVVYPVEQLKCLDLVWHRQCFKCQTCGMSLSMNNYRGYEKKPYCSAHYPQPKKFTVIADTPELQRFAQNTQLTSNVKYHEAFEKGKGSKISVTDDPVTLQNKATMQTISQAAYHQSGNRKSMSDVQSPTSLSGNRDGSTGLAQNRQSTEHSRLSAGQYVVQPAAPPAAATATASATATAVKLRSSSSSETYRAIYDYTAKEEDEVTFIEGDIILNGDPIAEGWMYGTVQRTGQFGMLPSNYVELVQ